MKQIIFFFIFITLIMSLVLPVFAHSTDSLYIETDEISRLNVNEKDTIIKLFCGSFMKSFSLKNNIADIVSDDNVLYMVIKDSKEIKYYKDRDGEFNRIIYGFIPDWSEFYEYAFSPNTVFDSDVNVEQVYCLSGEASHDGVYIYYVTNKGEYVLFKEYLAADEMYLFPIEDFYLFSAAVYENRVLFKDADGGGAALHELFELDAYLVEPKTNLNWFTGVIVTIFVIVAIIGTICFIHNRKVKLEN